MRAHRWAMASCLLFVGLVAACRAKAEVGDAESGAERPADAATASSAEPGSSADAEATVRRLMDAGTQADAILALRPSSADYVAVWGETYGPLLEAQLEPQWKAGKVRPTPWGPDQTELLLASATRDEFEARSGESNRFPRGYQRILEFMKPELRFYAFRFVRPGESSGASWEGLVFVDGAWRIFPKAWRAAEEGSPVYRPNSVERICKTIEALPAAAEGAGAWSFDGCIEEMTPRAQDLGVGGFEAYARCIEGLESRAGLENCRPGAGSVG